MSADSLKYSNETDRAFGLAGMAISLVAWDAEDWLESINLDAPADEGMRLSDEYYLHLAPGVGAKAIWEQSVKRFQITVAMTVANVICRKFINQNCTSLSNSIETTLCSLLSDEAAETCALEPDEVNRIYRKSINYCTRLFSHPGVIGLTKSLVKKITDHRHLHADEILNTLSPLNHM